METTLDEVVEQLKGGQGVLLVGDAGVGKTYLAAAAATRLVATGWASERIVGSPSIRTVGFGAIQHLFAGAEPRMVDEMAAMAEGHLHQMGKDQPTVLVVDDLDLIDDGSAAIVHRLAATGSPVVATVRSDGASAPHVLPMWKDEVLVRVDIATDRNDTQLLAEAAVGGPVGASVVAALADLTLGNPLFIRELIADGRATGSLTVRNGTLVLDSPLRADRRVTDLMSARFEQLETGVHEALELLAFASPIALSVLAAAVGADRDEQLETAGFLDVVRVGADEVAMVSHPLIAEVARASTKSMQRRRYQRTFAETVFDNPPSRPVDLIRAVTNALEVDMAVPVPAVLQAARHALAAFDGAVALRCLESVASEAAVDSTAKVMLGRAHLLDANPTHALEYFESAQQLADTDADRAVAAVAHGEALLFGLGDPAGATAVLANALATLTDVGAKAQVSSTLITVAAIGGDLQPALNLGLSLTADPSLDDLSVLSLLVLTTLAQALTGRHDGLADDLDRAEELAAHLAFTNPVASDQILVTRAIYVRGHGQVQSGLAILRARLDDLNDRHPMARLIEMTIAQLELHRGHAEAAVAAAEQGLRPAAGDPLGLHQLGLAIGAYAYALVGDVATSQRYHDMAVADPRTGPREAAFLARSVAQCLALEDDHAAAAQHCLAESVRCGDNRVWALDLLHDAVRFGCPDVVIDAMQAEVNLRETHFGAAQIGHAEALVRGDAEALRKVSVQFCDMGADLFAAETAAQAGACATVDGDHEAAARDLTRAAVLHARCGEVRSPAMELSPPALSAREHEVAVLAADGVSTSAISEQLFISQRTVSNHLQKVYKKLGVNQRQDLRAILKP